MHLLVTLYFFLFITLRFAIEVGLIVFALLGLLVLCVPAMRRELVGNIGGWQTRDSWVAVSLMSVFLFKLISSAWSASPALGLSNAIWHLHFAVWPLVFIALAYCKPKLADAMTALALGLIVTAAWTGFALIKGFATYHTVLYRINYGVLAELVLVCGTMLLVCAVQPDKHQARWRTTIYVLGVIAAFILLYSTHRRTEWLAFFVVLVSLFTWHYRRALAGWRGILALLALLFVIAVFFYLRQDRFLTAYREVVLYFSLLGKDPSAIATSVGVRLEMYRLGLTAFLDHPIFGMGSGVRPYLLQAYGGGSEAQLPHRHFHSEYLQTLVEGGIVWALLLSSAIIYWLRSAVLAVWPSHPQLALMAFYLSASFMLAGSVSAGLIYGAANGTFVVFSALIWACIRLSSNQTESVK